MVYPAGKRKVVPVILPDFIEANVDVEKLVDVLTIVLYRSAPVKLQLLKMDLLIYQNKTGLKMLMIYLILKTLRQLQNQKV